MLDKLKTWQTEFNCQLAQRGQGHPILRMAQKEAVCVRARARARAFVAAAAAAAAAVVVVV